jgi:UDP-3-O-[3-hydroxymyristoyl] glucosamine N-acyltransferase
MSYKTYTLKELAKLSGASLVGDPHYCVTGVDALDSATAEDVSFLANPRYAPLLAKTQAGVVCIHKDTPQDPSKNFLISEDPSGTFQTIVRLILQPEETRSGFRGIHPTAVIHPSAHIGIDVVIGPYAVIDQGATLGDRTVLEAHVFIGAQTHVGTECHFYPHATVREGCLIGNRVILQPGAVIGSCGFGFNTSAAGVHTKLEQLGTVVIEDDVEIGANTTIDRARFKTTRIGKGTKIDNLVQIGHNVQIGEHNLIVSQTGIAGSVKTGKNVIFGGQAGIVGHIEIASGVMIASRGGVSKSILKPGGRYAGAPVLPLAEHNVQQVHLRKIASYVKQIQRLEERLSALEEKS